MSIFLYQNWSDASIAMSNEDAVFEQIIRNSSANSVNQTSDICKVYYYVRNCSILFAGRTCVRI